MIYVFTKTHIVRELICLYYQGICLCLIQEKKRLLNESHIFTEGKEILFNGGTVTCKSFPSVVDPNNAQLKAKNIQFTDNPQLDNLLSNIISVRSSCDILSYIALCLIMEYSNALELKFLLSGQNYNIFCHIYQLLLLFVSEWHTESILTSQTWQQNLTYIVPLSCLATSSFFTSICCFCILPLMLWSSNTFLLCKSKENK